MNFLTFCIADIVVGVPGSGKAQHLGHAYRPFLRHAKPDVLVRMHNKTSPYPDAKGLLFDASGNWSIDRICGKYVVNTYLQEFGRFTYKTAVFNSGWTRGDIYLKDGNTFQPDVSFLLEYPLDEIVFMNLLPKRQGFLIHGCGISYDNKGLIFAGASGAGKSTMSKLWKKLNSASLLNDDRLAVRYLAKKWWVYGTPWHVEVVECMPKRSPLSKIFFIKHAKENALKKLAHGEAVAMLLSTSFVPFWDKDAMSSLLELYSRLVAKIPCYELGFVPDKSVIGFLRSRI